MQSPCTKAPHDTEDGSCITTKMSGVCIPQLASEFHNDDDSNYTVRSHSRQYRIVLHYYTYWRQQRVQ